jgi:L-amino acid N-acyltransferase YncA
MRELRVRDAGAEDWPAIWPIFREIVQAAETYPYDPEMSEERGRQTWMLEPPARVTVAVDGDAVVGTANMLANREGPGGHVAGGSIMVGLEARGRGVGRVLCEDLIAWARAEGFRGIQWNAVVDTNEAALRLYWSLGFEDVGTVPGAFRMPDGAYAGLTVMYLPLA